MGTNKTLYLTIPKEKTSRILNSKISRLLIYEENNDKIKLGIDKGSSPTWRVSLWDYKFQNEKVETPDGSVETGVIGTEMEYVMDRPATTNIENKVSEYIETG